MYSWPFPTGANMIELGGGDRPMFRPNLDFRPGPTVDIVADLNGELPLKSSAYDGVYSGYSLEHVSWRSVNGFLSEVFRILKDGCYAVFIVPNLLEQAKKLVAKERWGEEDICMIFGDQDYVPGNVHMNGFSPEYAFSTLKKIGFSDVVIVTHPNCTTDMIIEAKKPVKRANPALWTAEERRIAFGREYFEGGSPIGGYNVYRDSLAHKRAFDKLMTKDPRSVLEIGCARGYILKRIIDAGVKACGLEISKHCYLTRAVEEIKTWDIIQIPWPIGDKEFDLLFSCAVLDRIPENKMENVILEMERVSNRGLHIVDYSEDSLDETHCTVRAAEWWEDILPDGHEVMAKEEFEGGPVILPPPDGTVKLNLGSFSVMFYHGWTNIDKIDLSKFAAANGYIFRCLDVRNGLPYDDGIVDLIFTSHMIEHLNYAEARTFLSECYRVLRRGGVIRILCPDAKKLMQMYTAGTLGEFDEINKECSAAISQVEKFWSLIAPNHLSTYDRDIMCSELQAAGFVASKRNFRDSGNEKMIRETTDMFPDISLFIEGVKL